MPRFQISRWTHGLALALVLPALMLPGTVLAESEAGDAAPLKQALDRLETLQAGFEQTVLDSEFTVDEVSSGTFAIKRPGRFRWDYQTPFEQLIISDGEEMWIYEPDMEQASVQPMDETLATSPAMLLTGRGDLEDSFRIEDDGVQGELHWFRLTPRVQDSEFEVVRIALGDETVELMELRDNLGQTTRIEFHSIQHNPDLDDSLFQFTPPDGVDVIGR
ncbi:outer membrane lipoprotein carrier protein [Natronospira proteinivora]|uniref:Outer-membrane lipoprotein carrier protein n=1 Tax=Natronospira proteinivora TaxID=1807133 RepID=A0ABT1G608_9GAMM|nr:outer membrane lipoprotein chaperone LolA [Natronospira proteinivora]MCP1726735.1 outer membrane lipoprotein carrier protein [Natronospira proteinivora]